MQFIAKSCLRISSLFFLVMLLPSCSSRHWIRSDDTNLDKGDTVYRLETCNGDTISYAGFSYEGVYQNSLTGVSYPEFIGAGGIYDGESVCGVDEEGKSISVSAEDILQLEVHSRATMYTTAAIFVVGLTGVALIFGQHAYSSTY